MHVFCFLNNKCEDIATACLMVEVLMEVGVLLGRDLKPSVIRFKDSSSLNLNLVPSVVSFD